MGLAGALNIGRTALLAHQAAIEVTGNNLANVATRGYHRQSIDLAPVSDQQLQAGVFLGRGVQINSILRQVDMALEGRLRNSLSDEAGAGQRLSVLSQIESMQNELSDQDLSTRLSEFFNAFSELANRPLDNSLRSLVVQQGASLASFVRDMRAGLTDLRNQMDGTIDQAVAAANDLLTQIQDVNRKLALADGGTGGANSLRDQRDQLLAGLAEYFDFSVVEQDTGAVDIYVNSLPLLLGTDSRGLALERTTVNDQTQISLLLAADHSVLTPENGKLGAMVQARQTDIVGAITALDDFTNQLIFQVNRVHSQGQGTAGFTSVAGSNAVADVNAALNDAAATELEFTPVHGSFDLHLTQKSTGSRQTFTIDIDLDGINPAGDTTLTSLAAAINAASANVTAGITGDGRLQLTTASGDYTLSFSDDSSGILATLGLNTYFTGNDAKDIQVNALLQANGAHLAVGQGHVAGDNRNALAIAGLRTEPLADLNGLSLAETWNRHVEEYAIRKGQTKTQVESAALVRENLQAQQQSVGGVNTDEEAINLLSFQRAYQASARFLTTVDEMYQTLLQLL